MLGGAATAATASIVAQGYGLATGLQDKFSFKQVALSAIGGGVTAGLGDWSALGKAADGSLKAIGNAAIRGMAGSAIAQGVGAATGLQSKFDFAGVAAAGVAAGVGHGAGHALGATSLVGNGSLGNFGANVAVGAARLIANAATRGAIRGNSFGDNIIAALPDTLGQIAGDAIGGAIARSGAQGAAGLGASMGVGTPVAAPGQTVGDASEIIVTGRVDLRNLPGALSAPVLNVNLSPAAEFSVIKSNVMALDPERYNKAMEMLAGPRFSAFGDAGAASIELAAAGLIPATEMKGGGVNWTGHILLNAMSGASYADLAKRIEQLPETGYNSNFGSDATDFQLKANVPLLGAIYEATGSPKVGLALAAATGEQERRYDSYGADAQRQLDRIDQEFGLLVGGSSAFALTLGALPVAGTMFSKGSAAFYGTGFSIGFTGGGAFEYAKNEMFGLEHTPGGYVSSMIFGGVGATGFQFSSKSMVLDGALYGFFSNVSGQGIDRLAIGSKLDLADAAFNSITGGVLGKLGGFSVPGVNAGRGNNIAIYRGLETRLTRGVISQYQPIYGVRAGIVTGALTLPSAAAAAVLDGASNVGEKKSR